MLSRISIRGFKSFAEPVALDLVPGINVVVGPNGSGKSNVVEAVLWALGEQRATRLRAGAMGEVLFSGGGGRKAAPLAQVSLTLGAPEEGGAEVETTRRLTSDGESRYRLSGASCRLMDVQEALAARGLGPDALAIVRQGQVESVCTGKPSELRAIVDEAAGIASSKRQRLRAQRRLGHMRERLARARDLRGELEAQARRLERQARSAARAAELDRAIAEARVELESAQRRGAQAAAAAAEGERAQAAAEAQEAEGARVEAETLAAAADQEARSLAQRVERDAGRAARVRAAAGRVESRAELVAERLAAAREAAERAARARDALEDLEAGEALARSRADEAQAALERAEAGLVASERAAADAAQRAARARETSDAARRARVEAERRRADLRGRAEEARGGLARLDAARSALGVEPDLDRLGRREEIAAARLERWSAREREAGAGAEEARSLAQAAAERARSAMARASAIRPVAETLPGQTLGAGLEVEEGMERAIAAALGAIAEARPTSGIPEAKRALADGARAAAVPARPAVDREAPGASAWSVVLACPEASRALLEPLLEAIRIVDDLSEAPARAAGTYVTREGLVLRGSDGSVARADEEWADRARYGRLAAEATEAERVAQDRRETADRLSASLGTIGRRRRATERSAAAARSALDAARGAAADRARQLAEQGERRAALQAELVELEAALAQVEVEEVPDDGRSDVVEREVGEAERAAARSAEARREVARAHSELTEARAGLEEASGRLARVRGQASTLGGHDLGRAERASASLAAVGIVLDERARAFEAAATDGRRLVVEADGDLRRASAVVAAARERESRARAGVARADALARVAIERLVELGGDPRRLDPEVDGDSPAGESASAVAERLAGLERTRAGLGAVNALAQSEREELTEREAELGEQMEDLEAAERSLLARLEELDAAVTEGFGTTFDRLAERFSAAVGDLFPGGQGVLRQVEDDDGEAGIVIEVVPAGKRPRSMSLLSGGERSLVALAFCLALAQTRTAPVYLLDEVEAALDDVNLRRFLGLVRKLATTTQFLLVTHQQPTVEVADAIYGVTMRDGVSQLVSRRLDQRVEGPARPFVRRRLRAVAGGRDT